MNLLISDAWAEGPAAAAGAPPGGSMIQFVFLGGIFLLFYFLIIRPQSKRAKEHRAMVDALAKGDEVVTNGGIIGRVSQLGDTFISVEIADGVEVKVQRQAVASVLPKGTIKSA
ncbi:MAG: preprotein translocase subunit YajC [Candidatus Muproteobacteria bacterium RBG_19FT_COMBO_61_10]|jgi:preprotein translocase subunit YajC|uniref:Sec translocon accessory complex subunit YajC n=1 Tax=Candidatus Muproteobacteria bacterium RBG_19FT_COMBO_61_10 TaxID=1817761 RepID=A0A1F6UMF4_9PROT|nr:MAG: preprotein translocase subunit YajC [Candidatus Muproteobacteria bacterium RBG_19FT_COMBO_61_10]